VKSITAILWITANQNTLKKHLVETLQFLVMNLKLFSMLNFSGISFDLINHRNQYHTSIFMQIEILT